MPSGPVRDGRACGAAVGAAAKDAGFFAVDGEVVAASAKDRDRGVERRVEAMGQEVRASDGAKGLDSE
jgi:hypothetical protein